MLPDYLPLPTSAPAPADAEAPILRLTTVLARAMAPDHVALAASFGRWWLEPLSTQIVLSQEAAALLGEQCGLYRNLAGCLSQVLPEDLLLLTNTLSRAGARSQSVDCEFRVAAQDGVRWLRLVVLPADPRRPAPVIEGIVTDVTAVKHAAMREQFSFESTQLLIGTHTLDEAVNKVIELVCTDLGWDCGMYWSVQQGAEHAGRLVCVHHWSTPAIPAIDALINLGGKRGSIAPGQGLVGGVWSSGQPRWIEDVSSDPEFLFPQLAHQSGLRSGYAFPVAYGSGDGGQHRPGVLAFFSCMARQRTAQLPNLSAAIGGLIAQTAQRIAQQESIRLLAQTDVLSGLANRRHFHELLDAACEDAAGSERGMGLLYIDLDRFKPINDALGHETGDAVLRQFAHRLDGLTPPDGVAGRVGGDEFALLLTAGASPERLAELAELILQAARARFVVNGRELAISASVGVSRFPDNGVSGAELLRHADTAMYRAKRNGRNGVSFFSHGGAQTDAAAQSALMRQLSVETELIDALAAGQLFMQYQPVFSTHDKRVRAVEALIRWRRPDGEVVPPDLFIPIAEKSHLIVEIGRWVVRQACRDLPRLHRAGLAGLQMNVNMAAREFLDAGLPDELSALVAEAGILPQHLCLELTEGMMMNHADQVIPVMRELRRRGFKISIDDFGMAYSSLSRLKDLPISSVKIDRSFVAGLPGGTEDGAIVQSILDIGRNMQLEVIAEGVENGAQWDHLCELGCTLIQGYLMGRPMLPDELIATHAAAPAAL
jgi:diguanylate cyclase (GGDEF)-like protein